MEFRIFSPGTGIGRGALKNLRICGRSGKWKGGPRSGCGCGWRCIFILQRLPPALQAYCPQGNCYTTHLQRRTWPSLQTLQKSKRTHIPLWHSCPVIIEIFSNLLRIDHVNINIHDPTAILFAFPSAGMGTRALAIIIWKFIIQHFYSIEGPTAPTNTALIWVKSLRRFAELALRYEESIRRLAR
eukprot:scaffold7500_cov127-Isochrysis_galbana.AAC.12